MINIRKSIFKGIILEPSNEGFDGGAATFATIFIDEDDPKTSYLFYTGASDAQWSHASIGLATSKDYVNFRKSTELNPIIEGQEGSFCCMEACTPAVARVGNHFYMIFAGKRSSRQGRRIGIAYADDPKGPYRIISELIKPKRYWEGNDIDIGPSIAKLNENELLIYYSNVSNKWSLRNLFGSRYWLRKIGILKLRITSPSNIYAHRYERNPLKHLNGAKGSWDESLFCPGYLKIQNRHYLFPATSTYSIGFPYRQYISMITNRSPYFQTPERASILINGPKEKAELLPNVKGEIALDTPSPLVRGQELWLYYAIMDRADGVWKTALSIFDID